MEATTRSLERECQHFMASMTSKYAVIMDPTECTQSILKHIVADRQWLDALSECERESHRWKQRAAALTMKCETVESEHVAMRQLVAAQSERLETDAVNLQDLQKRISKLVLERNGHREQAVESEDRYQAVFQEIKSLKEERLDLIDRINALSLGLKRKSNDYEAMELELRQKAEQRADAEMENVKLLSLVVFDQVA